MDRTGLAAEGAGLARERAREGATADLRQRLRQDAADHLALDRRDDKPEGRWVGSPQERRLVQDARLFESR